MKHKNLVIIAFIMIVIFGATIVLYPQIFKPPVSSGTVDPGGPVMPVGPDAPQPPQAPNGSGQ